MGFTDALFQFISLLITGVAIGIGVGIAWGLFLAINHAWDWLRVWHGQRKNHQQNIRHFNPGE